MLGKLLKEILSAPSAARRDAAATLAVSTATVMPEPATVAVVMVTICRDSLLRAVRSVFAQDYDKSIHLLIGVDVDKFGRSEEMRATLSAECPSNVHMTWLEPGYSTSRRNGGIHACHFGGALRTILTFLANAPVVAYLDDDDWYGPQHLVRIVEAIKGKSWAYSLCYYADGDSGTALCVDELESVGVDAGIYKERFGGFVRPSALAIDKTRLAFVLHLWSEALGPGGDGEDRLVFDQLRNQPHGSTSTPTVYYALDPHDGMHGVRVRFMESKGVAAGIPRTKAESVRA